MIQKKICMLGAFAVGKTSLVARYVKSMFSEKYLTSVGVKIDKKTVRVDDRDVQMMLWDLQGEDEFIKVRTSYFRGASGYLLVVDGTRRETVDTAFVLRKRVEDAVGVIPFILLLNKVDLTDEWELDPGVVNDCREEGLEVMLTSAKTGQGVNEAFEALAGMMLED